MRRKLLHAKSSLRCLTKMIVSFVVLLSMLIDVVRQSNRYGSRYAEISKEIGVELTNAHITFDQYDESFYDSCLIFDHVSHKTILSYYSGQCDQILLRYRHNSTFLAPVIIENGNNRETIVGLCQSNHRPYRGEITNFLIPNHITDWDIRYNEIFFSTPEDLLSWEMMR